MIPDWLRDKLSAPPTAGDGIHAWLFSCARQLHAHMPAGAVEAALMAATSNSGRRVPAREIRDAVQNSRAVAWSPKDSPPNSAEFEAQPALARTDAQQWPKPDEVKRIYLADLAARDGVLTVADFFERSPVWVDWAADDWLEWLFPDAEWLCLALDHPATARSRRREKWSFGAADECGLVVPSPMTGASGLEQGGGRSHRCLDNTGERRWLVIEFDGIPLDEQARLHWHFRAAGPAFGLRLCLALHSGGKSLHGWYGPVENEADAFDFFAYAVSLGADPATWNRCQLVRLPGGRRKIPSPQIVAMPEGWASPDFVTQEVLYFDPLPLIQDVQDQFSQAAN